MAAAPRMSPALGPRRLQHETEWHRRKGCIQTAGSLPERLLVGSSKSYVDRQQLLPLSIHPYLSE